MVSQPQEEPDITSPDDGDGTSEPEQDESFEAAAVAVADEDVVEEDANQEADEAVADEAENEAESQAVPTAAVAAPAASDGKSKSKKAKDKADAHQAAAAAAAEEEGKPRRDVPTEEEAFASGRVWYIIHTYSGHENKVKTNLEHRIASMDAKDLIYRVVVPTEDEIEIREGQRRTVSKKIFPGYILVQMVELVEDDPRSTQAWFVVRNTPGVTGFVGSGTRPVPLGKDEVSRILGQMRVEEPKIKVGFELGESVRIVDGPFQDFVGQVDDLNLEKGKVKVLVSFFGRETPVELDFLQVEKL